MQRAMVRSIPHAHGVVAEHHRRFAGQGHMKQAIDRRPSHGLVNPVGVVVVAQDQSLLSLQALQIWRVISKSEISKVIDKIAGCDDSVPTLNQNLVHFLNGRERPAGQFDNSLVSEMVIGREKDVQWVPFQCWLNHPPT
jgi:hypothetical protein